MEIEEIKVFGLNIRRIRWILLFVEIVLGLFLLITTIGNLFGGLTWLPFLMNSLFLILNFASIFSMFIGFQRSLPIYFLPILTFETVSMFWTLVWLYASYTSGVEGNMWSLEWLGGPQSDRDPQVTDVRDPRYFDRSQTDPETQRAINLSGTLFAVFMLFFFLKIILWIFAKNCFVFYQNAAIAREQKLRDFDPIRQPLSQVLEEEEPTYTVVYRKNDVTPTRVLRQKSNAQLIGSQSSLSSPTSPDHHRISQYFESEI